ncbi:MAG: oligosaccharide flippase family protein [Patescibacteria group bacterium]
MSKIANIAKNTSYFTFALILQKVISFTYFTVLARNLGPEDLGRYYFAISFTTIFAIFIDLGLSNVLTREVAKDEKRTVDLLGNILALKIPLSIFSFLLVLFFINSSDYPELTRQLVYISSISMILDSFTLTFFAVIRGFHNLFFESIASVIFQIVILSSGIVFLRLNMGLRWLLGALAFASIFNFLYSLILVWKKWGIGIRPKINKGLSKQIIRIAIPFAMFAVFQRFYTYLDSVILSALAGDRYLGLYQVAFKIIFALQFLPLAFTATLYPAMSSYWVSNKEQLSITFERAMNYLIIISIPIAFGIIALADKIVLIFKSGYEEAVLPLQITMVALIFIFLNFPIGSLLNACDRQKQNTKNMGIVLAVSVILNIVLIPANKAIGASITVVATNFLMLVLGLVLVPGIIKVRYWKILRTFFISLAGALVMAGFTIILKSYINIFLLVLVSAIIYFAVIYRLGGFKKEDVISIYKSFSRKIIKEEGKA